MADIMFRFVDAENADFKYLTQKLDDYYIELVGDVHLQYAKSNHPKNFAVRIVAYDSMRPVACGCWKVIDDQTAEIKRIYVCSPYRRKGIATQLIEALEESISASGRSHILLETAKNTPASATLYASLGYINTEYYGSPAGAENCLCFEKNI